MRDRDIDLIQGTLNVLILRALTWGPANGYAIAQWARDITAGEIAIEEGALYPPLHRMERRGVVNARLQPPPHPRPRKYSPPEEGGPPRAVIVGGGGCWA